ncbi:ImmA/IrrE family metallo-endopeptidase [Aristophania vespae]|uniref:ImmA/IrrE family metallo-endopeptidase n=1 Tax=Aristophania vespae TaxID=2697033 RepID=UPI0038CFE71E
MKIIVPPIDPRKIAKFLGVGIKYRAFPKEHEDVVSYIRSHSRQIIVNDKQNASRMFFTVAHELGHNQLHRD